MCANRIRIEAPDDHSIGMVFAFEESGGVRQGEANAAYIVEAVNGYEAACAERDALREKGNYRVAEIRRLREQLAKEKKLSEAISRDCNACANERNEAREQLAAMKALQELTEADYRMGVDTLLVEIPAMPLDDAEWEVVMKRARLCAAERAAIAAAKP
jgi:hypothetical protein